MNRLRVLRPRHLNRQPFRKAQTAPIRDEAFKPLSAVDINHFRSIVGPANTITNSDDLESYNTDWMQRFHGQAQIALRPKTTAQVSEIMSYCNDHHIAIVPQGGNTGLVGGSVPVFDEVVLNLGSMNEIEDVDEDTGVAIVQAGVILETLDNVMGERGYRVPLDLGAKGSCQIGGNVATNAGGSRFIRYGSLRGSVLGLECVLPDGRILDLLTGLRKDNTGYDLKQLFIGSEGTLGVITRVAIACATRSVAVDSCILCVERFEHVVRLLRLARGELGEILSAFEFMDGQSVNLATGHLDHVKKPTESEGDMVLIECAGSDAEHNRSRLEQFLEKAFEEELVTDGVLAESETQNTELWELRESLPEAVAKAGSGGTLKYDVSLPLDSFYKVVEEARERVRDIGDVHVVGWGHVGDGNLHLNVAIGNEGAKDQVKEVMEPWVYEFVAAKRGSVSAEHGLGVMKATCIGYSKSDVAVDVMRDVKRVLDQRGICNPYKMLPPER